MEGFPFPTVQQLTSLLDTTFPTIIAIIQTNKSSQVHSAWKLHGVELKNSDNTMTRLNWWAHHCVKLVSWQWDGLVLMSQEKSVVWLILSLRALSGLWWASVDFLANGNGRDTIITSWQERLKRDETHLLFSEGIRWGGSKRSSFRKLRHHDVIK